MKQFLDQNMPNYIESVRHGMQDLQKFQDKATKHGLPQVLLFTSKAKTSSLTKYLSTEFRRQLLIGEIYPTKKNHEIMEKYGISTNDLPALLVIPPSSSTTNSTGTSQTEEEQQEQEKEETSDEIVRYDGDGYTKNKLQSFLSKHALKEKVYPKKKEKVDASTASDSAGNGGAKDDEGGEQDSKRQQHTEF
mmetsp:Transcript_10437/g.14764  ORF Transcript_10437/g.14764 Transcript_10437/m.14764 type:complete len:191 (-) Transcript_10437:398-970(-)